MNANPAQQSSRWSDFGRKAADICRQVPVTADSAGLCRALTDAGPGLAFRQTLARGGWHRLGGVVDRAGARRSDDLAQWAEAELAQRDGDLQALVDDYADSDLRATRLNGKTRYLVTATGPAAVDFLQVEVEELQEVVCPFLFAGEIAPGSLDELIDPPQADSMTPLGTPHFVLRRVTDVAEFLARMRAQKPEPQPVHRLVEAWQNSSAGHATQLSNHWVMALSEHLDRFRQPILSASPVAALNGLPPRFETVFGAQGLALYDGLQRFDRHAGYPMAWFFHMMTTKSVPHAVANAVIDDVQAGFSYLPERDVAVVKQWLYRPYSF